MLSIRSKGKRYGPKAKKEPDVSKLEFIDLSRWE